MARNSDQRAGSFEIENTGGMMSGLLAEEDVFDRRTLWRIGSWGVGAVGAVVLAVLANQSQLSLRREQVAAADLTRQTQQLQSFTKETTNETRRLASAVDTLNGDRDRLYSRVTVLEQGLDSVTGAIAKQNAAATQPQAAAASSPVTPPPASEPKVAAQNPAPAPAPTASPPAVSPVATTMTMMPAKPADKPQPAAVPEQAPPKVVAVAPKAADPPQPAQPPLAPLVAAKSMMAPPDPAATKLIEPENPAKTVTASPIPEVVAAAPPAEKTEADTPPAAAPQAAAAADVAVQKTEFGVDIGGANSVPGLRALWRGLLKSRSNAALTALRPIMVIREGNNGLGMQLRLVAGPLSDAAAAAKICAGLIESDHPCATTVFDGQRLAMKADEHPVAESKASAAKPAAETKPAPHRHVSSRRVSSDETPKKPETTSTLSSFFGGGKH